MKALTSPTKRRRVDAAALSRLFDQLALATRSGLPLGEAVAIARQDTDAGASMLRLLESIGADLAQGMSLSDALKRSHAGFAPETLQLVRAAEGGPGMGEVLDLLASDYELEARFRTAVRAALAWPMVSFVALLIVSASIVLFVVPQFEAMFSAFGASLPGPTRLVIGISNLLGSAWFVVLPMLLVAVWWVRRNDLVAIWLDGRLGAAGARAPIVGSYFARSLTSRLSTLLAATVAGAPLRESLAHLRATLRQAGASARVAELEQRVAGGLSLPEAVAATTSLPSRLRVAVELGSRTQRLGESLRHAVAVSDDEMGRSLLRLEQSLLVGSYLIVGLLVGFIVIALYLPIFKMGSVI